MQKILIVEDEENIARFLELELGHEGYAAEKAADGRAGLAAALAGGFDLVLLDIMLPGLSGLEVLRRLRRESAVPVILLTARDGVTDKVSGLDMGANDYITKPFAIEELLARIRVVLRTSARAAEDEEQLIRGELVMSPSRHTVTYAGQEVELTPREFALLEALLRAGGRVLTRDALLEKVWGYDYAGETNTVDVYVRYLRAKLDERFDVHIITTVRGVGYVIKREDKP